MAAPGRALAMRRRWLITSGCAVVFSFVYNLLRLTGPIFILLVHDRVLPSGSADALLRLFFYIAGFFIIMGLVDYSRRRVLARLGAQFQEDVEIYLLATAEPRHVFMSHSRKPSAGLNEIDNLRGFIHSDTLIAILDFLWAPLFLGVVFYFHLLLGWTVVIGLLGLLGLSWLKGLMPEQGVTEASKARSQISQLKDTILTSRRVIKTQGLSGLFSDRWLQARELSRDKSIALADRNTGFSVFSRQLRRLLQYSVLAVGAYLVLQGELSLGAMVASMFLAVRVLVPVEQFIRELPAIWRVKKSWSSLRKLLADRELRDLPEGSKEAHRGLQMSGVSTKSSLTGQRILKSVAMTVAPGEWVEINGPTGAGKTALVEAIVGATPLASGSINVSGHDIGSRQAPDSKRLMGFLPESVELLPGSLEENIAGFDQASDQTNIIRAAQLAGIHNFITALPLGYSTEIDPANIPFSQGERYRLGLARALYREPGLLVIDQPDSMVSEGSPSVLDSLIARRIDHGPSLLVLARHPVQGLNPDRRYQLERGMLKEADAVFEPAVALVLDALGRDD